MKFIILLSLFCVLLVAKGAVLITKEYSDPDQPGKCVINGTVLTIGGKPRYYSGCYKIVCSENSMVSNYTCDEQTPPEGKILGERIRPLAAFPGCCDRELVSVN